MKITQNILDFRSVRVDRDSKNLEKTRQNLVKNNQELGILSKTTDLLENLDLQEF